MCSLNFVNYLDSLSGSFVVLGVITKKICHYHKHHKYCSILLAFSELCTFLSRAIRLVVMSLAATVYLLGHQDPTFDPASTKSHATTSTLIVHYCLAAVSGVTWPISDAFIIRGILSLTVIVDCLGGSLELPRVPSPTTHTAVEHPNTLHFYLLQGFVSCSSNRCIILWGVVCVNKHEVWGETKRV